MIIISDVHTEDYANSKLNLKEEETTRQISILNVEWVFRSRGEIYRSSLIRRVATR